MRYPFIHQERQTYPVQLLCAVFQVRPSGYYRFVQRGGGRAQPDPALILQIQRLHRASRGTYGSRRMCQALQQAGYSMGRYRTRTLMRQAHLKPRRAWRRPQTTDSRHALPIAPNVLNRQFAVAAPIECGAVIAVRHAGVVGERPTTPAGCRPAAGMLPRSGRNPSGRGLQSSAMC